MTVVPPSIHDRKIAVRSFDTILRSTELSTDTQYRTFYELSVSSLNLFSKAEMRQFGTAGTEGLLYVMEKIIQSSSRIGNKI